MTLEEHVMAYGTSLAELEKRIAAETLEELADMRKKKYNKYCTRPNDEEMLIYAKCGALTSLASKARDAGDKKLQKIFRIMNGLDLP